MYELRLESLQLGRYFGLRVVLRLAQIEHAAASWLKTSKARFCDQTLQRTDSAPHLSELPSIGLQFLGRMRSLNRSRTSRAQSVRRVPDEERGLAARSIETIMVACHSIPDVA